MQDKQLECLECKKEFLFSKEEQQFFYQKGLLNTPRRCADCRLFMRMIREGRKVDHLTDVACEKCGTLALVPFIPKGHSPVYCTRCHQIKVAGGFQNGT